MTGPPLFKPPLTSVGSPQVPEDSLRRRYAFKIGTNLGMLPLNFSVQWMMTHAMGPSGYGSVSFLTNFFTNLTGFFDVGTSSAFYTKLSSRPEETGIVRFYWRLVAAVSILVAALVGGMLVLRLGTHLWLGQPVSSIVWAMICAFGIWFTDLGGKVMDAYGYTAPAEMDRLRNRILRVAVIGAVFWAGRLTPNTFFAAQTAISLLLLLAWQRVLRQRSRSMFPSASGRPKAYALEFWHYSSPLLTYSLTGLGASLLDRWLLERINGSVQQGFYGLSYQIGAFCFLFTSAMVPLLARDFAKAHHAGDLERLRGSFSRHVTRLYALSAFLGIFLASEADRVTLLFGGAAFARASIPMAIMCLYPIHQTYGQLNGSLFLATGDTTAYRNIGIGGMVLGLILTWVFLAPARVGGLHLASTGLAAKMVLTQVIAVNFQLWFICRQIRLKFGRFLGSQAAILGAFSFVALAVRLGIPAPASPLGALLLQGPVYVVASAALVWWLSGLFQIHRSDLDLFSHALRGALGQGKN